MGFCGGVGRGVGPGVDEGDGAAEGSGLAEAAGAMVGTAVIDSDGWLTGDADIAGSETGGDSIVGTGVAGPLGLESATSINAPAPPPIAGAPEGIAMASVVGLAPGSSEPPGVAVTTGEALHSRPGPKVARAPTPRTATTAMASSGFRIADGSSMTGARQTESGTYGGASERSPTFPASAAGWLADPERDSMSASASGSAPMRRRELRA